MSQVPAQETQKPTERKNAGQQPNNRPQSSDADLVPYIDALVAEARAYREEHESDGRGRRLREWLTILLLVATTFGVFWQVYEMVKVYEPVEISARASREAADVSRDALHASSRAWVGPRNAQITEPKIGSPLEMTVTYQNTGQEPA